MLRVLVAKGLGVWGSFNRLRKDCEQTYTKDHCQDSCKDKRCYKSYYKVSSKANYFQD